MTAFQCFIVDDEPIAIDILNTYLNRLEGFAVKASFTNPIQAFEALQHARIDLLFLDIQMPELTGLDLLKSLHQRPEVILTTAYRKFALDGYELDVVDYLLKPVSFERFLKAVDKFHARVGKASAGGVATTVGPDESLSIFVRADRKNIKIPLSDILYLESLKDYVRIVTAGGKILTKQTLTHFEEHLPADRFLRTHRSFLVARDKVTALSAHGMEIGKQLIPVGRQYKQQVADNILKNR